MGLKKGRSKLVQSIGTAMYYSGIALLVAVFEPHLSIWFLNID